jgi:hypothetical protein
VGLCLVLFFNARLSCDDAATRTFLRIIPGSVNLVRGWRARISRFKLLREFVGKSLICRTVFTAKQRLPGQNRQNSRFDGKNRETPQAALRAVARSFPTTPPIPGARVRTSRCLSRAAPAPRIASLPSVEGDGSSRKAARDRRGPTRGRSSTTRSSRSASKAQSRDERRWCQAAHRRLDHGVDDAEQFEEIVGGHMRLPSLSVALRGRA